MQHQEILRAILALRPGAELNVRTVVDEKTGTVEHKVEWLDKVKQRPSDAEIAAKIAELAVAVPTKSGPSTAAKDKLAALGLTRADLRELIGEK